MKRMLGSELREEEEEMVLEYVGSRQESNVAEI
jgi:hypothetical protein